MGAKESKTFPITSDEAFRKISDAEKRRMHDAFRRLSTSSTSGSGLNKSLFIRSVLGEGIPQPLGESIFNLCSGGGGRNASLSFREVVTVLVLLTKGTKEEKLKFVFGLLSNESNTYLERGDLIRYLKELEPQFDYNDIVSLFHEHDKVTYDTFVKWIEANPNALGVVEWLLSPDNNLSLAPKLDTPTFYQTLAGVTHLEEQEIVELEKRFWNLIGNSNSSRIELKTLTPLISPPLPENLIQPFFSAFDENQDGHIDFKELSCGVSAACRGPEMERHKFCFKVFDADHDGVLNPAEIEMMCQNLIEVKNQVLPEEKKCTDDPVLMAKSILEQHDPKKTNNLSVEEFLVWSVKNSLLKEFANLIFQLCHIALGLKPFSKKDEADIVLGWLDRESKAPKAVSALWHLINMEWWNTWKSYITHHSDSSPRTSSSAEFIGSKRGTKKIPSIDSTLASDADKSIVGTSYHPIGENGSIKQVMDNLSNSSKSASPFGSPHTSRKNSSSIDGAPPSRPGVIDNTPLLQPTASRVSSLTAEGGKLKPKTKICQGKDYLLIPERLWKALVQWYGGSPSLPRQVIRNKDGEIDTELYPLSLKLLKHQTVPRQATNVPTMVGGVSVSMPYGSTGSGSLYGSPIPSTSRRYHAYQAAFSRRTTVRQINDFLCQRLHIKPEDLRLWHFKDETHMDLLSDDTLNLETIGMKDDDSLLVEVRARDGTWPEEITSLCNSNDRRYSVMSSKTMVSVGITGLNNLGNTCYMNTSIQAVAHTKILAQYFNQNCHLHELNRVNPLGTKGHMAKRCGDLIKDMWSSETRTIAPIKLRWTIGRYQPHFAGVQQQDAQELLSCLLDLLHEDLNRVTEKPYAELKDSDGRPDVEVAKEAWENHILRNKSIVVDLFHGQLKSKVTCKVCKNESVRFDPFTFLSLPLPMESSIHIEVIVILQNGSVPVKYGLTLDMESRYSSIKTHLSQLCKINAQNLILVDIVQSQFRAIQSEEQKLKGLNGSCIYAYEFYSIHCASRLHQISNQTFSEIQRGTINEECNGEATSVTTKSTEKIKNENNVNLNSESSKDKNAADEALVSFENNNDKIEKESVDSPRSGDKTALLPNDVAKPKEISTNGGIKNNASVTSATTGTTSHSRQGSSASSVQSHDSNHSSTNPNAAAGDIGDCQQGVIVALHRKMMPQEVYFMSVDRYRPILFGIPLILACTEETTNQDLYKLVWTQVSRLVSPLPPRDSSQNHATDCDDSLRYEYPFTLKIIQRDGSWCCRCPWHRFCRGCALDCDSNLFDFSSSYLAIDWDQTALHLRYLSSQERTFEEDSSVHESQRAASEPITLKKCLEAFTREEVLGENEKYYCTSCKSHQMASIKLQIWRLPPILIIHLKRFHYLNGRWKKSHKIVDFPVYGLDLGDFLAALPGATLMRYKSLKKKKRMASVKMNGTIEEISEPNSLDSSNGKDWDKNGLVGLPAANDILLEEVEEVQVTQDTLTDKRDMAMRRKRLESTSLAKHPIKDDDLQDFHQHRLKKGADPLEIKYNLYSMVNHSGILGGGHYISYAKSKSGKWYCQNDSTCKEITEDQIDKSTAYMLFYERESLSEEDYLPNIREATPDIKDLEEELESDFKKQCVVM